MLGPGVEGRGRRHGADGAGGTPGSQIRCGHAHWLFLALQAA